MKTALRTMRLPGNPQPIALNADPAPLIRCGSLRAWMVAVRPRTLLVAISPVLVGAAFGFQRAGAVDLLVVLLILGAALLVQVATNLQNDVGYTVRGADHSGTRTGLPRATANGWLKVGQLRAGICAVSIIATGFGLALVAYRGWPVLLIGAASLLAALAYMGGPKPIAYTPWGEITVFLFFGLVAVTGTEWVLIGSVEPICMVAAVAIGSLAAAALAVNNHRDANHDRLVGRRTFAVMAGEATSRKLYFALLTLPFLLIGVIAVSAREPSLLLPMLLLPTAIRLQSDFMVCPPGRAFNLVLFRTFRLQLGFAVLLSAGTVLIRLLAAY